MTAENLMANFILFSPVETFWTQISIGTRSPGKSNSKDPDPRRASRNLRKCRPECRLRAARRGVPRPSRQKHFRFPDRRRPNRARSIATIAPFARAAFLRRFPRFPWWRLNKGPSVGARCRSSISSCQRNRSTPTSCSLILLISGASARVSGSISLIIFASSAR